MKTITESKRGCGYRKRGGLYFFGGGTGYPCGMLPIPLHSCPTCSQGIKFSRGFQWIKWELLTSSKECTNPRKQCWDCPFGKSGEKLGLLWVGEKFYPTPADFRKEGVEQGISKRIKSIPHGFKIGETWIALAHMKAVPSPIELTSPDSDLTQSEADLNTPTPGIFQLFKPSEVQYVVKGDETPEALADMEKRGITVVNIEYTTESEQSEFEFANTETEQ